MMYQNFGSTKEGILTHCKVPVEWLDCPDHQIDCYISRCRVCGEVEKDCEEYDRTRGSR